jgi:hypothetical protein
MRQNGRKMASVAAAIFFAKTASLNVGASDVPCWIIATDVE